MFVSFFPNPPRLFFWSAVLWAAVCVAGWYAGGAALGDAPRLRRARRTAARRSASRASGRGRSSGSTSTSPSRSRIFAASWQVARAASLVALVDPRLGADPLHHLLPGRGLGRDQRLVRPVLRPDPGGARQDPPGRRSASSTAALATFLEIALVAVAVGVLTLLLRQPLRLPLAHGDERLLHVALAAAAARSRAPRSACRKTPCASPAPPRASASASSTRS